MDLCFYVSETCSLIALVSAIFFHKTFPHID